MKRISPFAPLAFATLIGLGILGLVIAVPAFLGPVINTQFPDPLGPPTKDFYEFERISTSPDASKIAFIYDYYIAATQENRDAFYLVNRDGSDLQLVGTDMYIRELVWSPDGNQLACVGIQDNNLNILVVDAGSGHVRQLISDPDLKSNLTWFSDGGTLAYERRAGSGMQAYLVLIDIGTGKTRQLTTVHGEWILSPDNNRVALIDEADDQVDIFAIDIDGTDRQQLTDTSAIEAFIQWSPDGEKLAYLSQTEPPNSKLWLHEIYMVAMPTHAAQLVTGDYRGHLYEGPYAFTRHNDDPTVPNPSRFAWSPDGTLFAFETNGTLYVADADGANPLELVSPDFRPVMVGWLDDSSAVLASSYDGDYLAANIKDGATRPLSNKEIAKYYPIDSLDIQKVCTKDSPRTGEWALAHPCLRMELHIVDKLTNTELFRIVPEQLIQPELVSPPK